MCCAVLSGNLPIVQYLCEVAKVNTEAKSEYGRTALHIACEKGYLPIVQYLCEVAKVNTEAKDKYGMTAIRYANNQEIFDYLTKRKK